MRLLMNAICIVSNAKTELKDELVVCSFVPIYVGFRTN